MAGFKVTTEGRRAKPGAGGWFIGVELVGRLFAESLSVIACLLKPVAGYIEFHDDAVVHQAVDRRGCA
jgi:hypothetical protein